jgi:hypothetical protein
VRAFDRFVTALAKHVDEALHREGLVHVDAGAIEGIAEAENVPAGDMRAALEELDAQGLLIRDEGGWSYKDGVGLALRYEEADRPVFYSRNQLRRAVLRLAGEAYSTDPGWWEYKEDSALHEPWAEVHAAAKILEEMGLLELRLFLGHALDARLTPDGYRTLSSEAELAERLPLNAAEDPEAATTPVVPDAMATLITSVEQLVRERNWTGVERELRAGDEQYDKREWKNAVGEYYSALESGLKHRLDEEGIAYSENAALRTLAKTASQSELFPPNYQELFSFINSIRSPRSHGAGARPQPVEIGEPEALLMGNHVRALLLYLGHRPN